MEWSYMSEVLVKFYSDIKGVVGIGSISIKIKEGEVIKNLINRLCQQFPNSFSKVIYEPNTNKLNSSILILKNKMPIVLLEGENTLIEKGDEITFFAAVSGG